MTAFGGPFGIGIITLAALGYLLLERRYGFLSLVVVSVYGGSALALLFKDWINRPRPQIVRTSRILPLPAFPAGIR